MAIEEELIKLKSKLESAKLEKARLGGQLQTLLGQLDKNFQCKTIEAAQKMAGKLKSEIVDLEEVLETQFKEFQDHYGNI